MISGGLAANARDDLFSAYLTLRKRLEFEKQHGGISTTTPATAGKSINRSNRGIGPDLFFKILNFLRKCGKGDMLLALNLTLHASCVWLRGKTLLAL